MNRAVLLASLPLLPLLLLPLRSAIPITSVTLRYQSQPASPNGFLNTRFTITNWSSQPGTAAGEISAVLSGQGIERVRDRASGLPVAICPADLPFTAQATSCTLNPNYETADLYLYLTDESGSFFIARSLTLGQLARGWKDMADVQLAGDSFYYPNDSYQDTLTIGVGSDTLILPEVTALFGAYRPSDMNVIVTQEPGRSGSYFLERPLLTQLVVYFLGIGLPFLLLLGVFLILIPSRGRSLDTLLTVGLLGITLLLLRPVLIPASLTGPTLTDVSLSIAVVVLVAAATVTMGRGSDAGRRNAASEADELRPAPGDASTGGAGPTTGSSVATPHGQQRRRRKRDRTDGQDRE